MSSVIQLFKDIWVGIGCVTQGLSASWLTEPSKEEVQYRKGMLKLVMSCSFLVLCGYVLSSPVALVLHLFWKTISWLTNDATWLQTAETESKYLVVVLFGYAVSSAFFV